MKDEIRFVISMTALIASVTLTIVSSFVDSPLDMRLIIIALILAYISIWARN